MTQLRLGKRPVVTSILIAVSLGIVAAAERDLHRRPASRIRGSKWIWRPVCLNALGAIAYFSWGRQQPSP